MVTTYFQILWASWKTFGFGKTTLRWLLAETLFRFFTFMTMTLDNVFFPKLRNVEVKNPIFIIGHPRSGTTFLHKVLTSNGDFVAFKTWQLFFPALTARVLVRPLINTAIQKKGGVIVPAETGHEIALDKVEEEEFLFLHILDTQFVEAGTPLGFNRKRAERCLHDEQSRKHRLRSVNFLKRCFQRQLYATGKSQLIGQTHFSTHRIKTILEVFPDAKFIYLVRSPLETLPSFFSLLYKSIDFHEGIKNIDADRLQRYFAHRYEVSKSIYHYFEELLRKGEITDNQAIVLPYQELVSDLSTAFEKLIAFTGLRVSEELRQKVAKQAERQKDYSRKHDLMELHEFGITPEQIRQDFKLIFDKYGFETAIQPGY